ncbi:hypothetical protein CLOSBL3_12443 [Clostridiaceae bacterium BL-3]|nr:hypothetical protein CLOSBL3_12443 [Clostridiaceae bacterium BL-3]
MKRQGNTDVNTVIRYMKIYPYKVYSRIRVRERMIINGTSYKACQGSGLFPGFSRRCVYKKWSYKQNWKKSGRKLQDNRC